MTPTELCNVALGHLGQARIADIGERSPAAEHCRRMFEHVRRLCLRDHDWNFAIRRANLTALDAAPPFGYSVAYQLPADCLRVLSINGQPAGVRGTEWEVEGRTVLLNSTQAQLRYIADATDTEQWDSMFGAYFAYRLAAAIAPSLRLDPQAGAQLEQMAAALRSTAQETDAVESAPRVTRLDQSEIIQERGGWASGTSYGTGTSTTSGYSIGWGSIAVAGQDTVAATIAGDTFTLVAGSNVTLTTNATTKTITIAASGGGEGGATDLTMTRTAEAVTIVSSTGTDAEIPQANNSNAGAMTAAHHNKLTDLPTASELATALDGKAAASHTHSASQISDSTTAGRTILTAADATAQRTALGLGTLATQSGTFSGTSSGTNTGNVTLAASVSSVLALSGQQLQAVTDPGADRIVFFDQSANAGAGAWGYLAAGTGLSISGTTITATFNPASPGAIGGTTPSTAVFTQVDVRTELDIQSTSGAAGPILAWNTPTTEATNWERARFQWSSNVFVIGTAANGTGVNREVEIQPGGVTAARFTTDGRVGVGTSTLSPTASLTVGTPSTAMQAIGSTGNLRASISYAGTNLLFMENTNSSSSSGGAFSVLYANDGAAMASGDRLGGFLIGGSSSLSSLRNTCIVEVYATEAWVDGSAYGGAWNFATTQNGTTTRTGKMWINGDGNVGIGANVFSVAVQPTARLQIRGAGTGTGVTLLAENSSGTARFTVRDDGAFAFAGGTVAAAETGWTAFTNCPALRTCDVNTVTLEELARIVGTMSAALRAKGITLA